MPPLAKASRKNFLFFYKMGSTWSHHSCCSSSCFATPPISLLLLLLCYSFPCFNILLASLLSFLFCHSSYFVAPPISSFFLLCCSSYFVALPPALSFLLLYYFFSCFSTPLAWSFLHVLLAPLALFSCCSSCLIVISCFVAPPCFVVPFASLSCCSSCLTTTPGFTLLLLIVLRVAHCALLLLLLRCCFVFGYYSHFTMLSASSLFHTLLLSCPPRYISTPCCFVVPLCFSVPLPKLVLPLPPAPFLARC